MAGASMELTGQEATLRVLAAAIDKTEDKRGLFDAIGASLVVSTQHRFEEEKDPEGNPWPASLRAQIKGGRTLTDTARLVQSITHEATEGSVAVGTNVIYAAIHQVGGIIKAKTAKGLRFRGAGGEWVRKNQVEMPQRAFLGLDQDDKSEIAALCADWLGAIDDPGGNHARP